MRSSPVRFSEYFNQWLYGPEGYYANYKAIGKQGDFYTAVSTSKFFGGAIAKHIITQIENGCFSKTLFVCEIGAHHGYLLADIIEFIHTLKPSLLKQMKFGIIERFKALQEAQKRYLSECFGNEVAFEFYDAGSEVRKEEIFFISNEIFDAFPCELLHKGQIATVDGSANIIFTETDHTVTALAEKYGKEKGEIAVGYEGFAQEVAQCAKRLEFMSFDYGEMQARGDFSIRVYEKHNVYALFDEKTTLETLFGKSDITYDVTFEHVKDAFEAAGFTMKSFDSQLKALINMGILELLEILKTNAGEAIYNQELQKVKVLINPEFMGERFKMIRFTKGIE